MSTNTLPMDKFETTDYGNMNKIDEIYTKLNEINSQLKNLTKKQNKIDSKIASSLSISTSELCRNLEPVLLGKSVFNYINILSYFYTFYTFFIL